MPSYPPVGAIELSLGVPITGVLPRGVPNPLSGLTTPLGGAAISMSAGLPGTRWRGSPCIWMRLAILWYEAGII